jgi:hypothetical protein
MHGYPLSLRGYPWYMTQLNRLQRLVALSAPNDVMSGPSMCNFFSPRAPVTANDGAVTYYAQYGSTLHARAPRAGRGSELGSTGRGM